MTDTIVHFQPTGLSDLEVSEFMTAHCNQMLGAIQKTIDAMDTIDERGRAPSVRFNINKLRDDCFALAEAITQTRNLCRYQVDRANRDGGDAA